MAGRLDDRPNDVVKAATNLQSHPTSNVTNVAQRAAIAALTGDLCAVAEMRAAFDRRARTIVSMLNEIDGVGVPSRRAPSTSTRRSRVCSGRTSTVAPAGSSAELAELILDKAEVAVVPGEAFGTPGYLRLSYALGDDDLVEGVSRMQKLLADGPGRR